MPTGYTAAIADGISFEQYVWNCARAFGALVLMRDEPANAPIPDRFEESSYYAKQIPETRAALEALDRMSETEREAAAKKSYEDALASHRKYAAEKATLRMQYEDMLARVEAWQPPTPDHVELRKFMADQIRQSIDFDCTVHSPEPQLQTAAQWLGDQVRSLQWTLEYSLKSAREERERTENRNAWIKALRESVPVPEKH